MYNKILIIILIILASFFLKKIGLFSKKDGEVILNKVVFYLVLPAAVFLAMSQISLSKELLFLPLSAAGIMLICFMASWLYARLSGLESKTKGTFIISTMIMNMGINSWLCPDLVLLFIIHHDFYIIQPKNC